MKRIVSILLVACLFFTLTACKSEKKDNNKKQTATSSQTNSNSSQSQTTNSNSQSQTTNSSQGGNNVSTTVPANVKEAGSDTKLKRDGTYKKYFTLGLDDGITQDARIIEILKKYNAYCATFFINTGLFGKDWTSMVSQQEGKQVSHLRYTEAELKTGIYKGFDLECHGYSHASLDNFDTRPEHLKKQILPDVSKIAEISGYKPVGLAYPVGPYTIDTIDNLLANTDIRFARTTTTTNSFKLPSNFMKWHPTAAIVDRNILDVAQRFLDTEPTDSDMLFYVWGHGYNLDSSDYWDEFEALIKMLAEDGNVVFVTNAEFYQLFKDQIPSKGSK